MGRSAISIFAQMELTKTGGGGKTILVVVTYQNLDHLGVYIATIFLPAGCHLGDSGDVSFAGESYVLVGLRLNVFRMFRKL